MRKFLLTFLALALALPQIVSATIDRITTITGRTYRQCEIVRVHPDGVSFTHSKGAAKVLFMDLHESWRERLGYDPAKAAAYERELAAKRQQQAEARAAYNREIARAMAAAQEAELTRVRIAEEQARAAIRATQLNSQFVPAGTYPILPALGAVFDSRDYRYGRRRGWDRGWWPSGYSHGFGYGNGIYYGSSSGYYHLNQMPPSPGWTVHPPAPISGGFNRGSFTFQVNP